MLCCICKIVCEDCSCCSIWWPIAILVVIIATAICVVKYFKYRCFYKELNCFSSQKKEKEIEKRLNEINDTLKQIQSKMK